MKIAFGILFLFGLTSQSFGQDTPLVALFNGTTTEFDYELSNGTNITTTTIAPPLTTTVAPISGGKFEYNYTNNHICIKFEVTSLEMQITYPTKYGNHSVLNYKMPANAKVAPFVSKCGYNLTNDEVEEVLGVSWRMTEKRLPLMTLEFKFTRSPNITGDHTLDKSQLYKITADWTWDPSIFIDVDPLVIGQQRNAYTNSTITNMVVLKDRSYQCNSLSTIDLTNNFTMKFTGLHTQAFMANDRFDTAESCSADNKSSDLIPIIIGAVLAAIVLIVLVAYLIGRARMRRAATYESI